MKDTTQRSRKPISRCDRCGRRYRRQPDFNMVVRHGVIVGYICGACQTPEESLEAAVNEAMGTTQRAMVLYPGDPGYEQAHAQMVAAFVRDEGEAEGMSA